MLNIEEISKQLNAICLQLGVLIGSIEAQIEYEKEIQQLRKQTLNVIKFESKK